MARGTINGNTIHVTGFTPSTSQEQIYKVVVSGKSTAEQTAGSSVLSNEATVRRKKLAKIVLSNGGSNPECTKGGKLNIATTNVKEGTLSVIQYPSFVSSYYIRGNYLYYCLYPNYSSTEAGLFMVAGLDIYGKTVVSNQYNINNPGGDVVGSIELYYENHLTTVSIPGEVNSITLNYDLTNIIASSVTVNDYSGDISSISVSTGSSTVTISFPKNTSTVYDKEYTVTIKGENQYGEEVISNEVEITHQKQNNNTEFYITGNDIESYETTGQYSLYYPSNVIPSTITIYNYSHDTITSTPVTYPGASPMSVSVTTNPNTGLVDKSLVIYASARTDTGRVLYATGVILQHTDCYLTIPTSATDNVGVRDYVNPTPVPSYEQVHTFKYLSRNVQNIGAYLLNGNGTVSVNTSTKTVTVTFTKNTTTGNANILGAKISDTQAKIPLGNDSTIYDRRLLVVDRGRFVYGYDNDETELNPATGGSKTFIVVITGTSVNGGAVPPATYTFEQNASTEGGFTLTSGGTSSASIEYDVLIIKLKVSYPSDTTYSNFAVSINNSTSTRYKVFNTGFVEEGGELFLTGRTYANESDQIQTYTLQVSGKEGGNVTKYTNTFTITHRKNSVNGEIWFNDTGRSVQENATSCSNITFDYSNLSLAYVKECIASDGSYVDVPNFNFTDRSLTVNFTAHPAAQRTITLKLGGTSNTGLPCESGTFTITQAAAPGGDITVNPSTVEVGPEPSVVNYTVTYSAGINPGSPIYNSGVFSNVTDSGARILTTNSTLAPNTYQITFRGTKTTDGSQVTATLTVIQRSRATSENITISSTSSYYDSGTSAYVIMVSGGSYLLKIVTTDVNTDTLQAHVNGDNPGVTASTDSQRIYFDSASTASASTQVYVTGEAYADSTRIITSNTITFIQAREQEPPTPSGNKRTIRILDGETLGADACLDYTGSHTCPIYTPYEEQRNDGDTIRLIAYAEGYRHQTIVDTEDLDHDVTEYLNLVPIQANDLVVNILVVSTQHSNDYINISQRGTVFEVELEAYYASAQYRQCRVSLIIDHQGPYDVVLPDYAIYMHESTLGPNTDIGYVQYSLDENSVAEQFFVTNGTVTYTINLTIRRRVQPSEDYAVIYTTGSQTPPSIPGSACTVTFDVKARNIDLSTLQFTNLSTGFTDVHFDMSTATQDSDGEWCITAVATLRDNEEGPNYEECCRKRYTITGTSTLDSSTESYSGSLWQSYWRNLKFYVHASSQEVWDGETHDINNMSLNIESKSPYTIDLYSDNDWIVFMWDGNHKSGPTTLNDVYNFDVDYNVGEYRRECVVYAENATANETLTFWQSAYSLPGCEATLVSQNPATVPASGGNVDITFNYQGFDNLVGNRYDSSLITNASVNMSGASGTGTATLTIAPNTSGRSRQIPFTIYATNRNNAADISGELWIDQA